MAFACLDPARATFTPSAPLRQLIARGDAQGGAMAYIAAMTMLRALLAPIALLALSAPAFADKIALGDLSAYLNRLATVQSPVIPLPAVIMHRPSPGRQ